MHPFGFLAALLAADAERSHAPRRRLLDDVLPPIDDATLRAWHAWALGDPVGRRAPLDAAMPSTAPARLTAGQRVDRPA